VTARRSPTKRSGKGPSAPPSAPTVASIPMGSTGRAHPGLGLGLWARGRWTHDDETRTKATLQHALGRGVPWFDTAEVYGTGRSERFLGDALAHEPPATVPFLTTKVSWEHLRPAQVRAALQASLGRLGRKSVDVYLVHAPDASVPIASTMEAMEGLWKEGRIGAIGVSNFSVPEIVAARAALREAPLVVNQVRYSLIDPRDGDAVNEYCRANGIVVEAYSPLARGLLVGRYLDDDPPPPEVRRVARDLFDVDRFSEVRAKARAIRDLAKDARVPMASIALHWLRRKGAAPVFGASTPEQVDAILAAWASVPTDAVLDRADAIARGDA